MLERIVVASDSWPKLSVVWKTLVIITTLVITETLASPSGTPEILGVGKFDDGGRIILVALMKFP